MLSSVWKNEFVRLLTENPARDFLILQTTNVRLLNDLDNISCYSVTRYVTTSDPCPAGAYKDSSMTNCQQCPTNTHSAEGAAMCTACPPRSQANLDRTKCGKHFHFSISSYCTPTK